MDAAAIERLAVAQRAAVDRAVALIATMPPDLAATTAAVVGAGLGLSADLQALLIAAAHERLVASRQAAADDQQWRWRLDRANVGAIVAAEITWEERRCQVRSVPGFFFLHVMATVWSATMTQAQASVFGRTLLAVAPVPASRMHAWCDGRQPEADEEIAAFGRAALADAARLLHEPERATENDIAVLHALGPAARIAYGEVEALRVEPLPVPVIAMEPKPADEPEPEDEPAPEMPW